MTPSPKPPLAVAIRSIFSLVTTALAAHVGDATNQLRLTSGNGNRLVHESGQMNCCAVARQR